MFPILITEEQVLDPELEANYVSIENFPRATTTVHKHDLFEFVLVTSGGAVLIVNSRLVNLAEGWLTLIRPGEIHYFQPRGKDNCKLVSVIFSRRVFKQMAGCLGGDTNIQELLDPDLSPSVHLSGREADWILERLDRLEGMPTDQKKTLNLRLHLLLHELLIPFFRPLPGDVHPDQPAWMRELIRAMQRPENYRIGFDRMRQLAGVSQEHMARSFRRFLDITPTDYIGELRLDHAANLLAHTDRNIDQIADESGFASPSYFYRLFHQKYGFTPSEYRKHFQKSLLLWQG